MSKLLQKFLLLLLLLWFRPACGNELYTFHNYLNQVESGFWRAIFSPELSETKKNYRDLLHKILMKAQDIRNVRLQNGPLPRYGDLVSGCSQISRLLVNHSAFRSFRNKRFAVSGLKKTNMTEFRKYLRKNGSYSRKKVIPLSEMPPDEYQNFLDGVKEHNLSAVSRRFSSQKDLSSSQRNQLYKTAEDFYEILTVLRYNWLVLVQREGARFKKDSAEQ